MMFPKLKDKAHRPYTFFCLDSQRPLSFLSPLLKATRSIPQAIACKDAVPQLGRSRLS